MIRFEEVTKEYPDGTRAVKNLNLEIRKGEFVCLIGPSGCGKTTTLKMVNRLVEPTRGTIYVDGQDIMKVDPVHLRRRIGYVIQQIGLFPHMTIEENIALVPRLLGWDRERCRRRVEELLPLVGLDPDQYRHRYPRELSGGQQQRVGVLRALAAEPDLILMDEPFGALDPITREALQDELKKLQAKLHKTILFVTHDMDEALKLADRIVLMKDGEVVQDGSPEDLLRHPANDFVAAFIGRERMAQAVGATPVEELMIRRPVTAGPSKGLAEAVQLMRQKRVDSVVVVDEDNRLLGVVTARQIQQHRDRARTLGEIMSGEPACVEVGAPVTEALQRMFVERLDHLPVVDRERRLVGLITRTTLVDLLSREGWPNGSPGGSGQGVSA
ncbi:MAG: betaine/proline/choline family ABC transporter ATP-binding protein [Bacillota bacterium]|nr:MAG: proline/glycine betaine ABC transporter ATP-binding protein [Bacillota bacterium]